MASPGYDYLMKIILIGDSGVGKTTLLQRYVDGEFSNNWVATLGVEFKVKTVELDHKVIKLQIWDTAGQERFARIIRTYYRGAVGALCFFSVESQQSLQNVVNLWLKEVCENVDAYCRVILVATKCDLAAQADLKLAAEIAEDLGFSLIETSAKTSQNIEEVFVALTKAVRGKQPVEFASLTAKVNDLEASLQTVDSKIATAKDDEDAIALKAEKQFLESRVALYRLWMEKRDPIKAANPPPIDQRGLISTRGVISPGNNAVPAQSGYCYC